MGRLFCEAGGESKRPRPLQSAPILQRRRHHMSVRIAVIGAGRRGGHHARILSGLPGADLLAVVDCNQSRAEEIAGRTGARPVSDAREILEQVDAVTIAVPTAVQSDVAMHFLTARVGVLVETPIAPSLAEADDLIEAAKREHVTLAIGQSDQFNPAIAAVRPLVNNPRFIEVHRLGTCLERSLDIDVVFDLMIHDLDVVLSLVSSEVVSIEAVGVPVLTTRADIANATLKFANGTIANLTASRISRDRVRKIRLFQPASYLSVDYTTQSVQHWRLVKGNGPHPTIQPGNVNIVQEEPLRRELADFVDSVASQRAPLVTGHDGRRALALAEQVNARMTIDHGSASAAKTATAIERQHSHVVSGV
jgi:predicted dehydrogenase